MANWNDDFYDVYAGAGMASIIYFTLLIVVGNWMLINLFVAILLQEFFLQKDQVFVRCVCVPVRARLCSACMHRSRAPHPHQSARCMDRRMLIRGRTTVAGDDVHRGGVTVCVVCVQADKENMDEIIRIVVEELGKLSVEELHDACDDVFGAIVCCLCACRACASLPDWRISCGQGMRPPRDRVCVRACVCLCEGARCVGVCLRASCLRECVMCVCTRVRRVSEASF